MIASTLPPLPAGAPAVAALRAILSRQGPLPALEALRAAYGDAFRLPLPGFPAVVLSGPQAAHFVYVQARRDLLWRSEGDPVTRLLRRGLLVQDGEQHDMLRHALMPPLHRKALAAYLAKINLHADRMAARWTESAPLDMLIEMRRLALLILMDTLFDVNLAPEMDRLWEPVLKTIQYISPGFWLFWKGAPRPAYTPALHALDAYLYKLIARQKDDPAQRPNLISRLASSGWEDDLIRDQVITLLIAGHDTSTALLAWALYLLAAHPTVLGQVQSEVDRVLGARAITTDDLENLPFLEQVIQETLRLYPPIHASNRIVAHDLDFMGYRLPAGQRVLFSIYLTHRHPDYWAEPDRFDPDRFAPGVRLQPYTYVPFGGGARNCIGAAYARYEALAVLAHYLQRFDFALAMPRVRMHMGATLEPRPGVMLRIRRRM
jgi:cytochrome P450